MLAGHARPAYQALRSCTCHPRYPLVRSKASFQAQRLSARLSHHADHSSVGSIGHTASSPSHIAPPHSSAHLRGRASALRSSVGVQSEETDQQTGGTAGLGDSPSPLSVGAATGRKMVAEQNHQAPTSYPKVNAARLCSSKSNLYRYIVTHLGSAAATGFCCQLSYSLCSVCLGCHYELYMLAC